MSKRKDRSIENRVFRWYRLMLLGAAAVMLVIAGTMTFVQNYEPVLQEKSVAAEDVYSFSFVSQESGTDGDEVYYSDEFFLESNERYNHKLARASLALSMTAFRKRHAVSFLEELGFENIAIYRYGQKSDEDKVALAMGSKRSKGRPVIAVAVRGGKYGDEWGSNGRIGYEGETFGYHYGFRKAAEDAVVQLQEYAAENSIALDEAAVWISGFSRGAAVANVMGKLLVDGDIISPERMFDYTFASPSTVSAGLLTEQNGTVLKYRGIYNVVNPLDIVTRLPMNASGSSKTSGDAAVNYNWDYVKYGTTLALPTEEESAQLQVVQLLERALAFATRNESRYVKRTQDQVMIPALKKTMGKGANLSKRNVGFVLVDSLPGVTVFLKNEIDQLDLGAQLYVAGLLAGKRSVRLEKEHWPENYWGWMVKVDGL